MMPLFLCCRASGASTKYLYDKTFEMNRKSPFVAIQVTNRNACRGEWFGGCRLFLESGRRGCTF